MVSYCMVQVKVLLNNLVTIRAAPCGCLDGSHFDSVPAAVAAMLIYLLGAQLVGKQHRLNVFVAHNVVAKCEQMMQLYIYSWQTNLFLVIVSQEQNAPFNAIVSIHTSSVAGPCFT